MYIRSVQQNGQKQLQIADYIKCWTSYICYMIPLHHIRKHIKGLEWNRTRTRETWRYTESNKVWSPAPVRMWAEKYELIFHKIFSSAGHTSLYFPSVKITFLKNILVRCLARVVSVVMHKDLTGQQSTCSSIKVVFRSLGTISISQY